MQSLFHAKTTLQIHGGYNLDLHNRCDRYDGVIVDPGCAIEGPIYVARVREQKGVPRKVNIQQLMLKH